MKSELDRRQDERDYKLLHPPSLSSSTRLPYLTMSSAKILPSIMPFQQKIIKWIKIKDKNLKMNTSM